VRRAPETDGPGRYPRGVPEIRWNRDAIGQVVQKGFDDAVPKMQGVLDSVLVSERGKGVDVKATLAARWQQDLGLTASDEFLQRTAEQLAAGEADRAATGATAAHQISSSLERRRKGNGLYAASVGDATGRRRRTSDA
jgi:hypothetical protein